MKVIQFTKAKEQIRIDARKTLEEMIWLKLNEGMISEAQADRLLADLKYSSGEWIRVTADPFPNRKSKLYANDNNA